MRISDWSSDVCSSDLLLVMPSGGRLWRMNYRFEGRQKTLAFGSYPDVSLAKAREKRTAAREAMAEGLDPFEVKKAKRSEERREGKEGVRKCRSRWQPSH